VKRFALAKWWWFATSKQAIFIAIAIGAPILTAAERAAIKWGGGVVEGQILHEAIDGRFHVVLWELEVQCQTLLRVVLRAASVKRLTLAKWRWLATSKVAIFISITIGAPILTVAERTAINGGDGVVEGHILLGELDGQFQVFLREPEVQCQTLLRELLRATSVKRFTLAKRRWLATPKVAISIGITISAPIFTAAERATIDGGHCVIHVSL